MPNKGVPPKGLPAASRRSKHRRLPLRQVPHLWKPSLLVEDSKFLRIATERALTKAGYQVICAADGQEAVAQASAKLPDLVVLDMLLPKLSGPEVLQKLKANPPTARIPVLVLSSLSQKNEDKLIKEGATAFLEKAPSSTTRASCSKPLKQP